MNNYKKEIINKICYTDLVYDRINKKLNLDLSRKKIEESTMKIIKETNEAEIKTTGKNIYISNHKRGVRLTINSFTNRIITVDILNK